MAEYQLQQRRRRPQRPLPGVRFDRDVPVAMRDGVRLMANVFARSRPVPTPVVMSVAPYGKDALPEDYGLFRALGMDSAHRDAYCTAIQKFHARGEMA